MTKLETYLTDWLTDRDYELEVHECDDDFFYSDPLSLIAVRNQASSIDDHLLRFFYDNNCELMFSNAFIPAFLHELGHHETMDDFSDEEWNAYREFERSFEGLDMNNYNNQVRYLSHPIELAATMWAIDYINSHKEEVEELAATLNIIFAERRNVA